jgi:hypothetical protein
VAVESAQLRAGFEVPETQRSVKGAGEGAGAVGGDRHGRDRALVPDQGQRVAGSSLAQRRAGRDQGRARHRAARGFGHRRQRRRVFAVDPADELDGELLRPAQRDVPHLAQDRAQRLVGRSVAVAGQLALHPVGRGELADLRLQPGIVEQQGGQLVRAAGLGQVPGQVGQHVVGGRVGLPGAGRLPAVQVGQAAVAGRQLRAHGGAHVGQLQVVQDQLVGRRPARQVGVDQVVGEFERRQLVVR